MDEFLILVRPEVLFFAGLFREGVLRFLEVICEVRRCGKYDSVEAWLIINTL